MIRSQLSDFETAMLFYNSESTKGLDKLSSIITDHGLLKDMPKDKYLNKNTHSPIWKNKYQEKSSEVTKAQAV